MNDSQQNMLAAEPPLAVLVREKHRAYVAPFPYQVGTEGKELLPEAREAEYSPTGEHFVSIESEDLCAVVRDGFTGAVVSTCGGLKDPDTPLKINFATFSPKGTYLLTWSRPVTGVSVPNLVVYRTKTGERLAAFHQKIFHIEFWPSIQWSDDESIAARSVTNTIHFFKGSDLAGVPVAKLGIPGVSKFALSHGGAPYTVAAFIPGTKGAPGKIATFKHPDEGGEQLSQRSTFRADSVTFKWNSKGTAVLALISTNIDTTGKSYYGESEVYFMDNLGLVQQRVDLPQEGPTYDAAWSPTGLEFIIIYGYMPARATMFNDKCEPIFDFGTGSRNTISFSPHGRFVALAGFGNLAGGVEFWDKNKTTLVGRAQLPCTTMHSWSPCSRYFMGATTFPRLRVDNCLRVARIDGKLIHEHKMAEDSVLHQAVFRPALRGVFPDPKFTVSEMVGGPMQSRAPPGAANGVEKKKTGVYRPPGSRGTAASFSLHQHVEAGKVDKAAFLTSGSGNSAAPARTAGGQKIVPGMDPELLNTGPSKSSLAKKKKKERERKIKEQAKAEPPKVEPSTTSVDDIDSVEAAGKKIKKLKKKLRTIEVLENSRKEGKELNQDQIDKLASLPKLREELSRVENKLSELSV